jgi:hypothetical protein
MSGMDDMEINMIIKNTDLPAKIGNGHLIGPKAPEEITEEAIILITKIWAGTEITLGNEGIHLNGVVPRPPKSIFVTKKCKSLGWGLCIKKGQLNHWVGDYV